MEFRPLTRGSGNSSSNSRCQCCRAFVTSCWRAPTRASSGGLVIREMVAESPCTVRLLAGLGEGGYVRRSIPGEAIHAQPPATPPSSWRTSRSWRVPVRPRGRAETGGRGHARTIPDITVHRWSQRECPAGPDPRAARAPAASPSCCGRQRGSSRPDRGPLPGRCHVERAPAPSLVEGGTLTISFVATNWARLRVAAPVAGVKTHQHCLAGSLSSSPATGRSSPSSSWSPAMSIMWAGTEVGLLDEGLSMLTADGR